jgi:hypothetical protein
MVQSTGRNANKNDTATMSDAIVINKTTSTTLSVANADRTYLLICNTSSKKVWVKLQAASVDNDKKGIFLKKETFWEMVTDNVYTGEVSAIGDNDDNLDIYVTEY